MSKIYLDNINWMGGYYELSMEFNPTGNDIRIHDAMAALIKSDIIHGIWYEKGSYSKKSIELPIDLNEFGKTCYVAVEINDYIVDCKVIITRIEDESDWIDILISQSVLEKIYSYQYPLLYSLNPWLFKVDHLFITLAKDIFQESPFDFAMIGEDASGLTNQQELSIQQIYKENFLLPRKLYEKLDLKNEGEKISNELRLYRFKE
ncbi:hypothetical protein [Marininema halotolerans]|uniref:Uncharacterized protein n=1 Tax=Marininema halotolerans TaxID=1155944 RepID=A0A1I6UMA4_9BACL|nr:hypothetical protein [Marininema halotolerans]SFT02589.1 hypothetical protein SAMN05444972_11826 [Marininema halotolerans]